jgi:hypothetical protein
VQILYGPGSLKYLLSSQQSSSIPDLGNWFLWCNFLNCVYLFKLVCRRQRETIWQRIRLVFRGWHEPWDSSSDLLGPSFCAACCFLASMTSVTFPGVAAMAPGVVLPAQAAAGSAAGRPLVRVWGLGLISLPQVWGQNAEVCLSL